MSQQTGEIKRAQVNWNDIANRSQMLMKKYQEKRMKIEHERSRRANMAVVRVQQR